MSYIQPTQQHTCSTCWLVAAVSQSPLPPYIYIHHIPYACTITHMYMPGRHNDKTGTNYMIKQLFAYFVQVFTHVLMNMWVHVYTYGYVWVHVYTCTHVHISYSQQMSAPPFILYTLLVEGNILYRTYNINGLLERHREDLYIYNHIIVYEYSTEITEQQRSNINATMWKHMKWCACTGNCNKHEYCRRHND